MHLWIWNGNTYIVWSIITMICAQMHQFSGTFLLLRTVIIVPACEVSSVMWSLISIDKSKVLLWRDVSVNVSDLSDYMCDLMSFIFILWHLALFSIHNLHICAVNICAVSKHNVSCDRFLNCVSLIISHQHEYKCICEYKMATRTLCESYLLLHSSSP